MYTTNATNIRPRTTAWPNVAHTQSYTPNPEAHRRTCLWLWEEVLMHLNASECKHCQRPTCYVSFKICSSVNIICFEKIITMVSLGFHHTSSTGSHSSLWVIRLSRGLQQFWMLFSDVADTNCPAKLDFHPCSLMSTNVCRVNLLLSRFVGPFLHPITSHEMCGFAHEPLPFMRWRGPIGVVPV